MFPDLRRMAASVVAVGCVVALSPAVPHAAAAPAVPHAAAAPAVPHAAAAPSDRVEKAHLERFAIGSRALIGVSVATLWREPGIHRTIDRPSLRNPAQLGRWNRNLRTAEQRRWLVGKVQTQALYGQEVLVRETRGRWVKVAVLDEPEPQDPAGYPGWLPASQLRPKGDVPSIGDDNDHLVVLADRTRLRIGDAVVRVGYGTRLALAEQPPEGLRETEAGATGAPPAGVTSAAEFGSAGGKWVRVMTPDGPGRVPAAAVGPPRELTARSILAEGRKFLGLRYLWGGLSAWGMDCSGLIWNLFRAHGHTIPRDADPQFRSGHKVGLKRLQPADFLFWGTREYVHHVALYVGDGLMMEAPDSSGRVRIVPIRWRELVGARRYID